MKQFDICKKRFEVCERWDDVSLRRYAQICAAPPSEGDLDELLWTIVRLSTLSYDEAANLPTKTIGRVLAPTKFVETPPSSLPVNRFRFAGSEWSSPKSLLDAPFGKYVAIDTMLLKDPDLKAVLVGADVAQFHRLVAVAMDRNGEFSDRFVAEHAEILFDLPVTTAVGVYRWLVDAVAEINKRFPLLFEPDDREENQLDLVHRQYGWFGVAAHFLGAPVLKRRLDEFFLNPASIIFTELSRRKAEARASERMRQEEERLRRATTRKN